MRSLLLWGVVLSTAELLAQCPLQLLPGDGIPGLGGRAHATTTWDPDGAGPAPPLVAIGGEFGIAGTVFANNIVLLEPTMRVFLPLGGGIAGRVRAMAVAANGDLIVGGAFAIAGGTLADNIARWNGSTWASLGAGLNGEVQALLTMPNGDIIAGGSFTAAGGAPAISVARWDGAAWSAMGTGLQQAIPLWQGVNALARLANGDVIAGGSFSQAGAVATSLVAQWNGTAWSAMGSGLRATPFNDAVATLAVHPNGVVYAGGRFASGTGFLWQWNGSFWAPLAACSGGFNDVRVTSLGIDINGDLLVGGSFEVIGNTAARHIARWNGSSWSPLASGMSRTFTLGGYARIGALVELANGDWLAAGDFDVAGGVGAPFVASWNGTAWSATVDGIAGTVAATTELPNGDLVIGGTFLTAGGVAARRIARWDGTAWSSLGTGMDGAVYALAVLPNGDLIAGGAFGNAGGVAASRIARWDGTTWSALGTGLSWLANALHVASNGDLLVGGSFSSAGGLPANGVARWNGVTWSALGAGLGLGGYVYALAELPNGDVVAVGSFQVGFGAPANNVARWDGTSWLPMGSGIDGSVRALAVLPTGDVVAGGWFSTAGTTPANSIARWDGSQWYALGGGLIGGAGFTGCGSLLVLPDGDLAVGTSYNLASGTAANGVIERWDGVGWSTMAVGITGTVGGLRMARDGTLLVGGSFNSIGGFVTGPLARIASTCPAGAVSFGAGCTGSGGANTLSPRTLPWLSGTYRATAAGLTNGIAVSGWGTTTLALPLSTVLPVAAPTCSLWVNPLVLALLIPVAGGAEDQLAIPTTSTLIGQQFHHQVVSLGFDGTGALIEATSGNALSLTIGAF